MALKPQERHSNPAWIAKGMYLLNAERREDLLPPEEHRSLGQSLRELRWVQPK